MTSLLQVFYWGTAAGFSGGRQYYDSFSLNGCDYQVGDAVSLFPEDDAQPHFLARLESAYIDSTASDPHVITVSEMLQVQGTCELCVSLEVSLDTGNTQKR